MRKIVSPLDGIVSPLGQRRSNTTPGGPDDVLLLVNGVDGLLLVDGTSFLKLASSS